MVLWLSAALGVATLAAAVFVSSDSPGEKLKIRRELRKF